MSRSFSLGYDAIIVVERMIQNGNRQRIVLNEEHRLLEGNGRGDVCERRPQYQLRSAVHPRQRDIAPFELGAFPSDTVCRWISGPGE
jgi:hypothetical protein